MPHARAHACSEAILPAAVALGAIAREAGQPVTVHHAAVLPDAIAAVVCLAAARMLASEQATGFGPPPSAPARQHIGLVDELDDLRHPGGGSCVDGGGRGGDIDGVVRLLGGGLGGGFGEAESGGCGDGGMHVVGRGRLHVPPYLEERKQSVEALLTIGLLALLLSVVLLAEGRRPGTSTQGSGWLAWWQRPSPRRRCRRRWRRRRGWLRKLRFAKCSELVRGGGGGVDARADMPATRLATSAALVAKRLAPLAALLRVIHAAPPAASLLRGPSREALGDLSPLRAAARVKAVRVAHTHEEDLVLFVGPRLIFGRGSWSLLHGRALLRLYDRTLRPAGERRLLLLPLLPLQQVKVGVIGGWGQGQG